MPAASGEDIRSWKRLVDQPPRRESGRVPRTRGGCIRRETGEEIAVLRPGGVLALISGGRSAEGWMAAAAEPSILRHGWGVRNGDF